MFSFFKKKAPQAEAPPALDATPEAAPTVAPASTLADGSGSWWKSAVGKLTGAPNAAPTVSATLPPAATAPMLAVVVEPPAPTSAPTSATTPAITSSTALAVSVVPPPAPPARQSWLDKLRNGLRKTGSNIAQVFTGTQIDDALYEELESALLMADAGVRATEFLLADLKRRVKEAKATDPARVKALLGDALTDLLTPLEKPLVVGEFTPTVIMVVGVNGAGKTTSIGKLTRHLADAEQTVLLAAADTFRAAAREQLAVWADRNRVEIVSQEGADPAAVW